MREIKFRAWHRKLKEWHYFRIPEHLFSHTFFKDDLPFKVDPLQYENWGQYTGLKDKNGKEIYEGDILHIWSEYDEGKRKSEEGNWEVYWRNDRWHLRRNEESYDNGDYYQGDECPWPDVDDWKPLGSGGRIEVIGNIYENPGILENSKGER